MNQIDDLAPCPLCGRKPTASTLYGVWYVQCDQNEGATPEDESRGHNVCVTRRTKVGAVNAWNRRPVDIRQPRRN